MDKDLQRLLTVCSLFGVCWQVPKCCGPRGSHLLRIYIMLLMGILAFNCVWGIMKSKITDGFFISWVVATIVFISQMVTHFIIMYETLAKYQQHDDFIRILLYIEVYFKIRLKMNVDTSLLMAKIRSKLMIMIVMSKACLIVFALIFFFYDDPAYFWWALWAILAMRLRFIQVTIYVDILKYYLLALNKKLNQVVCLKTDESKQLLDIDYKHLHPLEIIMDIKHIYANLYEATTLMNESVQASLFAAVASNLLDFTCHIYWILLTLDKVLPAYNIVSSIATILPSGLFIFRFCCICQMLKDESQRTCLLLSRLLSSSACSILQRGYKNLVHDFCMQLMHQRIIFTGNGFFTFDLKCIFAICALIATHLIILIQFTKIDGKQSLNKANMHSNCEK